MTDGIKCVVYKIQIILYDIMLLRLLFKIFMMVLDQIKFVCIIIDAMIPQ